MQFIGFLLSIEKMIQALDEITSRDLPQAFQLLRELNESVQQATQLVDNMLAWVKR
jgi:hypothetical protein